jgi:predicted transcriptional regulator of viral defense system
MTNAPVLVNRIQNEFLEMPGLRLTIEQAARLWALDRDTSRAILDRLTEAGFLSRSREGAYVRASAA